jgi:hypothetical protein
LQLDHNMAIELMKKIYLDYNVFTYYFDGKREGLREKIDQLKKHYIFPYSPAHMEEIAVLLMKHKPETKEFDNAMIVAYEKIKSIADLTDNFELLPNIEGSTIERSESPFECFKRVIKYYAVNKAIESLEEERLAILKEADKDGELSRKISNLKEDFLSEKEYEHGLRFRLYFDEVLSLRLALEARKHGIKEYKWPDLSKSHRLLEDVIEITMNYIEEVRYKPEKISKSRSRMHDISHSIYATAADYIVSDDERFVSKTKATYNYFNIPTKIMNLNQFMVAEEFIKT